MVAGLDMKLAPATTIIHLSVRTIPPEEGEHRGMRFFWVTTDSVAAESNKKSLLGFSLRPSIRGRNSSAGVPSLTSNQPSNPAGPIGQPAPTSIPQQRSNAAATPAPVSTRSDQPAADVPQTRSRTGGVDDGTHGTGSSGGGCKCVIM